MKHSQRKKELLEITNMRAKTKNSAEVLKDKVEESSNKQSKKIGNRREDLRKVENDSKKSNMQTLRVPEKKRRDKVRGGNQEEKIFFSRIERQTNTYPHVYKLSRTERYECPY